MIQITAKGVVNVATDLQRRATVSLKRAMPEIAEMLRTSIDYNFRVGGRFGKEKYGGGTEKWKISYRAKEQGGQTLVDTRRLANSISYKISGDRIQFGTNVKYAAIHQYGGTIKAKQAKGLFFKIGKKRFRKAQVRIPRRPYLVFQRADILLAAKIVGHYLAK